MIRLYASSRSLHCIVLISVIACLLPSGAGCSRTSPESADGRNSTTSGATTEGEHEHAKSRESGEEAPHGEHEEHAGVVHLSAEAGARAEIRAELAEMMMLPFEIETTGQVGLDETRLAHVSPRIPGRVHAVVAELGREVRAGEVLAEIDSIELGKAKAEYLRARAMEEPARRNSEREQELFADKISSEKEALAAEAALREATADLRAAEETLHLYGLTEKEIQALRYEERKASVFLLRSPLAGRIVEKHATVGELVSPERNLYTVADLKRVWIWIDVYERVLSRVHLQDDVEVRVDAYPEERFRGKVSYLTDRVDPDSRTIRARVDVENAGFKLRQGMFARVRISDPHDAEGQRAPVLAVPSAAVLRDGEKHMVFVALAPNEYERRFVEVGQKGERWTEIRQGVSSGDRVVVSGGFLLKSEASKGAMGEGHPH